MAVRGPFPAAGTTGDTLSAAWMVMVASSARENLGR